MSKNALADKNVTDKAIVQSMRSSSDEAVPAQCDQDKEYIISQIPALTDSQLSDFMKYLSQLIVQDNSEPTLPDDHPDCG